MAKGECPTAGRSHNLFHRTQDAHCNLPTPRRSFGKVYKGMKLGAGGEATDQMVAIKIVQAEADSGEVSSRAW